MMASTGSRDRSTFMSSLRRSTSRREAATRRGGRKGEPTSPGLPTNNSVKFAGMRPSFLGQNHSSVLVFRAEPITTRAITTLHNLCPLSQEINAEATRWYSFLNNLSTKALSRDYLQSIKGVVTWLSSLRSGQCTSGYLVFLRLCGEGVGRSRTFAEAERGLLPGRQRPCFCLGGRGSVLYGSFPSS